jgi:hypothetical protein
MRRSGRGRQAREAKRGSVERVTKLAGPSGTSLPGKGTQGHHRRVLRFPVSVLRSGAYRRGDPAEVSNDVKFVFEHFPLPFHPWAKRGGRRELRGHRTRLRSGSCTTSSSESGFSPATSWRRQGYLKGTKVDLATWEKCAGDPNSAEYKAQVEDRRRHGLRPVDGVSGTWFLRERRVTQRAQPITVFVPLIERRRAGLIERGDLPRPVKQSLTGPSPARFHQPRCARGFKSRFG